MYHLESIVLSFNHSEFFSNSFCNLYQYDSILANVVATAATQSVERPILPTIDQKAKGRSISDTKATLKHQQNVLKLQQVIQYSFHLNFPSLSKYLKYVFDLQIFWKTFFLFLNKKLQQQLLHIQRQQQLQQRLQHQKILDLEAKLLKARQNKKVIFIMSKFNISFI